MSEQERIELPRKPAACPKCGSNAVTEILYRLPDMSPELLQELDEKKLVLGGCRITGDNPPQGNARRAARRCAGANRSGALEGARLTHSLPTTAASRPALASSIEHTSSLLGSRLN